MCWGLSWRRTERWIRAASGATRAFQPECCQVGGDPPRGGVGGGVLGETHWGRCFRLLFKVFNPPLSKTRKKEADGDKLMLFF